MHTITIQANDIGSFDVLLNGFSYRVNRNLSEQEAAAKANDLKHEFTAIGERSRIVRAETA